MTSQYIKQNSSSTSMPLDKFTQLMSAVLQNGTSFRFQASGFSMSPFIRDGDVITLTNPSERRVRLGEVIAFISPSCNKLAIHRVVGLNKDHYLIKADNNQEPDGWIGMENIVGCVRQIDRLNRPVRFGLGNERQFIAFLSRYNLLIPVIRFFLPLLRPFRTR